MKTDQACIEKKTLDFRYGAIVDNGATHPFVNSLDLLVPSSIKELDHPVMVGYNGKHGSEATHVGTLILWSNVGRKREKILITDCMYVPGSNRTSVSVPHLVARGYCVDNTEQGACVRKGLRGPNLLALPRLPVEGSNSLLLDERLKTVVYPTKGPIGDYGLENMRLHALYPIPDMCFARHRQDDPDDPTLEEEFLDIEANMAYSYSTDPRLQTMHRKCHAGMHLLGGMRRWDTGQKLTDLESTCPCLACIKAKIHRLPKSNSKKKVSLLDRKHDSRKGETSKPKVEEKTEDSNTQSWSPKKGINLGDHVSSDVKWMPLSESGYTGYVLFCEHHTEQVDVYLLRHKSEAQQFLMYYLRQFKIKHGVPIKNLHIDGGEMNSKAITLEMQVNHGQLHLNGPYQHTDNAWAESRIGKIWDKEWSFRYQGNAPTSYWEYSVPAAVKAHNLLPKTSEARLSPIGANGIRRKRPRTPHEKWENITADSYKALWHQVHTPFCRAVAYIDKERKLKSKLIRPSKHSDKGVEVIYLGGVQKNFKKMKGHLVKDLHTGRVFTVEHVIAIESDFPMATPVNDVMPSPPPSWRAGDATHQDSETVDTDDEGEEPVDTSDDVPRLGKSTSSKEPVDTSDDVPTPGVSTSHKAIPDDGGQRRAERYAAREARQAAVPIPRNLTPNTTVASSIPSNPDVEMKEEKETTVVRGEEPDFSDEVTGTRGIELKGLVKSLSEDFDTAANELPQTPGESRALLEKYHLENIEFMKSKYNRFEEAKLPFSFDDVAKHADEAATMAVVKLLAEGDGPPPLSPTVVSREEWTAENAPEGNLCVTGVLETGFLTVKFTDKEEIYEMDPVVFLELIKSEKLTKSTPESNNTEVKEPTVRGVYVDQTGRSFYQNTTETGCEANHAQPNRKQKSSSMAMDAKAAMDLTKMSADDVDKLIPQHFHQTFSSPYRKEIEDGENRELQGLCNLEVFGPPIPRSEMPAGTKAIGTMWVYKAKGGDDGMFTLVKGRLTLLGNQEKHTVTKAAAYAPVTHPATLRALLAMYIGDSRVRFHQLDVKQAYLSSFMDREVYVKHPPGYKLFTNDAGQLTYRPLAPGEKHPDTVMRLIRALYGGMECGRLFWNAFTDWHIKEMGFTQVHQDQCYLQKELPDGSFIKFVFHVDDAAIAQKGDAMWTWYQDKLRKRFAYTLGPLRKYLSLDIELDYDKQTVKISQRGQVQRLLAAVGMREESRTRASAVPDARTPTEEDVPKDDKTLKECRGIMDMEVVVGHLLYLQCGTRPDISYPLKILSRFTKAYGHAHIAYAKHVVRYLAGTQDLGLLYKAGDPADLQIFTDASHAGCKDTRRSITGVVVKLGGNTILWKSLWQTIVSHSSTESELMALDRGTTVGQYLKWLIAGIGVHVHTPVPIFVGNTSAIHLGTNPVQPGRNLHVHARYFYVRDLVKQGEYDLNNIGTKFQVADILCSGKDTRTFQFLRARCLGCARVVKDASDHFVWDDSRIASV